MMLIFSIFYIWIITPFPVPPGGKLDFLLLPPWGKAGKGV